MSPAALIAAGGRGDRAAAPSPGRPKQFREIAGKSLIEWSIEVLRSSGCDPVVVVIPEDSTLDTASLGAGIEVAQGGSRRQDSVRKGLELVKSDRVVIHDAARPLVSPSLVERVLEALRTHAGAVPVLPCVETIKRVERHLVRETIDRSTLWRAQTPQAFRTEVLKAAHERAAADGIDVTDDAQLLETYGGIVAVVEGDPYNMKITYPSDFDVAEALLSLR